MREKEDDKGKGKKGKKDKKEKKKDKKKDKKGKKGKKGKGGDDEVSPCRTNFGQSYYFVDISQKYSCPVSS